MDRGPSYTLHSWDSNNKIVWIIDNDAGGMSVTNAAEEVCERLNLVYPDYRIFYKDTMGLWFELRHNFGKFIEFVDCRLPQMKMYIPE